MVNSNLPFLEGALIGSYLIWPNNSPVTTSQTLEGIAHLDSSFKLNSRELRIHLLLNNFPESK